MKNRQEKAREVKSARKKRLKIHEVTAENDIRYQGPLNYQHFQMLGWMCIVASAAIVLITLGSKMDSSLETQFGGMKSMLEWIGSLSLPFLLIANFAKILNNSEGYRKQLIKTVHVSSVAARIAGPPCQRLYHRAVISVNLGSRKGLPR